MGKCCDSSPYLELQNPVVVPTVPWGPLNFVTNVSEIIKLSVFGFNSAKYDLNLIKSYLLPVFVNERNIEPHVINKANQFISFKIGDIQLLDNMNFPGGATSLDSFLKAYRNKKIFPLRLV